VPKATKRERQRLNRDARREAMLAEEKKRKRLRTIRNLAFLLIPLVILFVILQLTNSDDSSSKSSSDKQTCSKAPAQTIDPTASYTATMDTSEGTMVFALDAAKYPKSVNNFVFLAEKKFYNGLLFSRAAKDFAIQAGSPDNTQVGGPGYTVKGEVPTGTPPYPIGSLAMAKSGNEPAGTAGSQFFIVTGSNGENLTADYAFVGSITEGLDVAQKIAQLYPASGDGKPTKTVTIKKITVSSTPSTTTTSAP
jgi:peptidyl-prolyl cis-trans isomerase B (cyclophilin B)